MKKNNPVPKSRGLSTETCIFEVCDGLLAEGIWIKGPMVREQLRNHYDKKPNDKVLYEGINAWFYNFAQQWQAKASIPDIPENVAKRMASLWSYAKEAIDVEFDASRKEYLDQIESSQSQLHEKEQALTEAGETLANNRETIATLQGELEVLTTQLNETHKRENALERALVKNKAVLLRTEKVLQESKDALVLERKRSEDSDSHLKVLIDELKQHNKKQDQALLQKNQELKESQALFQQEQRQWIAQHQEHLQQIFSAEKEAARRESQNKEMLKGTQLREKEFQTLEHSTQETRKELKAVQLHNNKLEKENTRLHSQRDEKAQTQQLMAMMEKVIAKTQQDQKGKGKR